MDIRNTSTLRMHTRMREICLSVVKDLASDLKSLNSRYDWMNDYDTLQPFVQEWKENDHQYILASIKRWGQWSLEHKKEIDRLKK